MTSIEPTPGRFAAQYLAEGQAPGDTMAPVERIAAAAVVAPEVGKTVLGSEYDFLFDPNRSSADVEAAAIRPQNNVQQSPPARTSERPGYWKKPTAEQIAAADARKDGTDLRKQLKYYT